MILSFRDEWLRDFFVDDMHSKKIPSDIESRLFRKLQMIDDAMTDQDLRVPPSNDFEKLRGNLVAFVRSVSTNNGGWYFVGMAPRVRQVVSISTITATDEVQHVDDKA